MTQLTQLTAKMKEKQVAPPPLPAPAALPEPKRPPTPFVMTILNGDKVIRQEYPDYPGGAIVHQGDAGKGRNAPAQAPGQPKR